MNPSLSVKELQYPGEQKAQLNTHTPLGSSEMTNYIMENSMATLGKNVEFSLGLNQEGPLQANERPNNNSSMLSKGRNSSVLSDSKTQQYSQMWENEDDRQRVMARFRSFDMTGMTKLNSNNWRSPSQQETALPGQSSPSKETIGAMNGNDSKNLMINIITKLPSIATTPHVASNAQLDPQALAQARGQQEMLSQGTKMFTLKTQKDFVNYNTNNVNSNVKLNPHVLAQYAQPAYHQSRTLDKTEASSYLDRQVNLLNQQTQPQSLAASPRNLLLPGSKDSRSFVSFQVQSNLNQQSATSKANISIVSPANVNSQSPLQVAKDGKYENPKDKFIRRAHESLQKGKDIQMENQYNLANYNLQNKHLPVALPGEKRAKFYEKPFEEREKIDDAKMQKYVDDIFKGQGDLKAALKQSYLEAGKQLSAQSPNASSGALNGPKESRFDDMKSILLQKATEQNMTQSQRLAPKPKGIQSETAPFIRQQDGSQRPINNTQTILQSAKNEANQLVRKESPFLQKKFAGRIMTGMESVQQLQQLGGPKTARPQASNLESLVPAASHLPSELSNFLMRNQAPRPSRLQALSASVKHERKFTDFSITNKKIRQFSLFPQAKDLVKETRKYENTSQNATLKKLSSDLVKQIQGKESMTCLRGTENQADLLSKFEEFKRHDRVNPFTVEEYYFLRNNMPIIADEAEDSSQLGRTSKLSLQRTLSKRASMKQMRESMRQFAKDNDVIHVTIDKQSLAQLTNLSEKDIKRDENVKLVTNRDDLPANNRQAGFKDGDGSVRTMYGTFNVLEKSMKHAPTEEIHETDSRGTITVSKSRHMSPRNALFSNKGFKDSQVQFGATNQEIFKGEKLSTHDLDDQRGSGMNKTQGKVAKLGGQGGSDFETRNASIKSPSRYSKKESPRGGSDQSNKKRHSKASTKRVFSKDQAQLRSSRVKVSVEDQNLALKHMSVEGVNFGNVPMPVPAPAQQFSNTLSDQDAATLEAPASPLPKNTSPTHSPGLRQSQGPVTILSKLNPTTRNLESLQSFRQSSQKSNASPSNTHKQQSPEKAQFEPHSSPSLAVDGNDDTAILAEQMTNMVTNKPTTAIASKSGLPEIDQGSMPETEELIVSQQRIQTTENYERLAQDQEQPRQIAELALINQSESEQYRNTILGDSAGANKEASLYHHQQQVASAAPNLLDGKFLLNVDSTVLKLEESETEGGVHSQSQGPPRQAIESNVGGPSAAIITHGTSDQMTASFRPMLETGTDQMDAMREASRMNQTFREMEMGQTHISMKLGEQELEGDQLSSEEHTELVKFRRMSLPQQRDYITKMEALKTGFMTPGMQVDDMLDKRIQELDDRFKDINFGQTITHETFEYFLPKRINKDRNMSEYRDWKLRQIILKQHQFEERIVRFKQNLDSFKSNKKRIKNFRALAVQGYDKRALKQKEQQMLEESASQLLFLDSKGNLHNSSSKELHEMFLPKGSRYSGLDLRDEIESKVRQLLGRTELKNIASTAKVLVEISDSTSQQQTLPDDETTLMQQQQAETVKSPQKVVGLDTRKINLSPRQSNKSKLKLKAHFD